MSEKPPRKGDRKKVGAAPTLDRLPPHSIEMEQGVLGCCLLDPSQCIPELIAAGVKAEHFYDLRHQEIWNTLAELGPRSSLLTAQQHLKDRQLLDQVGGIPYLSELEDLVPSAANLSRYLETVREKAMLRRLITTCAATVGRVFDDESKPEELLAEFEREALAVRQGATTGTLAKDAMPSVIGRMEDYLTSGGRILGLGTGFPDLDRLTDGMHGNELICLAGRHKGGKTTLALNIVEHVALVQGLPVEVFSLEMTSQQLLLRMLCSRARVSLFDVRDGRIYEDQQPRLVSASAALANAPLRIDDTGSLSVAELAARARRSVQQFGTRLFVVDYLQKLRADTKKGENREREMAMVAAGLKALSKETGVPILALSQTNSEGELRESRAIEHELDQMWKIEPPEDEEAAAADTVATRLAVPLSRNGPSGAIELTHIKKFTRFESATRREVPEEAEENR